MSKRSMYKLKPLSQNDCTTGDHLYVHRLHKKGVKLILGWHGYTHHGIYIGDGKVVDFSGFASNYNKGPIRTVDFGQFAKGFPVYRWSYSSYGRKIYSPDEIAARAQGQIGEGNYNVVTKNCEHFASWCVTGRSMVIKFLFIYRKLYATSSHGDLINRVKSIGNFHRFEQSLNYLEGMVLWLSFAHCLHYQFDKCEPLHNLRFLELRRWRSLSVGESPSAHYFERSILKQLIPAHTALFLLARAAR